MKQQEGLIYRRKQEAEHEKEENRGGAKGAKKSVSVAGRKTQRRQKAATMTIHDRTSELHAQFSYHNGGQSKMCGGEG